MANAEDKKKKDKEKAELAAVDQAAAATDQDQAQAASDTAISKASEAIRQAAAAVQVAGQTKQAKSNETKSAVSAASAAASAAKAASEAAEAASAVAAEVSEGKTPEVDKHKKTVDRVKRWLEYGRQGVLVIASLILLYYVTENIIHHGFPLDTTNKFLQVQFWICLIFIADIIFGLFLQHDLRRYILDNWLFLLISIPYLPLIKWFGVHIEVQFEFVLRLVPLVRGGFALAIVLGWLIYDKASTLFVTYLTVLIATVYLSSVAFYTAEHGVNPLVTEYSDALWWACMDVTTVGCNIEAMTLTGEVLSVFVACMGIMMLPLFTVYITSLLSKKPDFNFN